MTASSFGGVGVEKTLADRPDCLIVHSKFLLEINGAAFTGIYCLRFASLGCLTRLLWSIQQFHSRARVPKTRAFTASITVRRRSETRSFSL